MISSDRAGVPLGEPPPQGPGGWWSQDQPGSGGFVILRVSWSGRERARVPLDEPPSQGPGCWWSQDQPGSGGSVMSLNHRVLEADGHRINQGQVGQLWALITGSWRLIGQSPRLYQELVTLCLPYFFSTHNAGLWNLYGDRNNDRQSSSGRNLRRFKPINNHDINTNIMIRNKLSKYRCPLIPWCRQNIGVDKM